MRPHHQLAPGSPTADCCLEGEQFANAYFDTETKIKMLVSLPACCKLVNCPSLTLLE